MTVEELKIALEFCLDKQDKITFLKKTCKKCKFGYFFVDDDNGKCYLFDENGNEDDIRKIKVLKKDYVRKDVKKIIIPNGVTRIVYWAFCGCTDLTSINIPNSVTSIGNGAFSNCKSLISINIPDSVTSIGNDTFANCEKLTSITIPDSVETIGYDAFYDCSNLKNVTFKGKTLKQIKVMENYPWEIKDESIIHCC